jgi:hypothetical protein
MNDRTRTTQHDTQHATRQSEPLLRSGRVLCGALRSSVGRKAVRETRGQGRQPPGLHGRQPLHRLDHRTCVSPSPHIRQHSTFLTPLLSTADAYWAFMAYHALMSTSDWKEAQHVHHSLHTRFFLCPIRYVSRTRTNNTNSPRSVMRAGLPEQLHPPHLCLHDDPGPDPKRLQQVQKLSLTRVSCVCRVSCVVCVCRVCVVCRVWLRANQIIRVNPYNIYAPCIGPSDPVGGCLTQQMALAFAARPERSQRSSSSSDLYSVGAPRPRFLP